MDGVRCKITRTGSGESGNRALVEHCIEVDADWRARLCADIAELRDAVDGAFLAMIDTVDDNDPTTPLPAMEVYRDGT